VDITGRFIKEKTLVGYQISKTGKSYNDVSEPQALYAVPVGVKYNWADKKTVLLTNRDVYSTANMFACFMKEAPNVTVIGGRSGGGGGLPSTFYLPNGWALTMSGQKMTLDVNKVHIEPGVEPDIYVTITEEDAQNKVDSILEKAIEILSE
jgi:C-terminal processing protease CtpA/Prc